jgi:hypothetical protein
MDSLAVSVSGNVKVLFDNVITEKNSKSFDDAVKPIVDSKVWNFDTSDGVVLSGGALHTKLSGDGVIELNGKKGNPSMSVPVNNRATLYTVAVFEAQINLSSVSSEGVTQYVNILTKDKETLVSFGLVKKGAHIGLCQVGPDGVVETPIYNYSSDKIKLSFEIFAEKRMIHIYNHGVAVAKTSIFKGEEFIGDPYGSVVIASGEAASTAHIDDVKFETLYKLYANVNVNSKGNQESSTKEPITFEHSSSGNLPTPIGGGLAGSNSQFRVDRVERDGEYTNALAFYSAPGSNDFMTVSTSDSLFGYSAVVFEADIFLDLKTTDDTTCYQMYFSRRDSNDRVYMFQLAKSGDSFTLADKSDYNNNGETKSNILKSGIKGGEWIKLKVEYFRGDKNSVRFRISLNGEVVSVSDNFFGSQNSAATPNTEVECFYFYTLNKCDGTLYLDNVALYGTNGSCSDEPFYSN